MPFKNLTSVGRAGCGHVAEREREREVLVVIGQDDSVSGR